MAIRSRRPKQADFPRPRFLLSALCFPLFDRLASGFCSLASAPCCRRRDARLSSMVLPDLPFSCCSCVSWFTPPSQKLVFIRAIRGSASALLAPGFCRLASGPKHHYRLRTLSREAQFLLVQKIFYQHLSPPSYPAGFLASGFCSLVRFSLLFPWSCGPVLRPPVAAEVRRRTVFPTQVPPSNPRWSQPTLQVAYASRQGPIFISKKDFLSTFGAAAIERRIFPTDFSFQLSAFPFWSCGPVVSPLAPCSLLPFPPPPSS
jgi:hypothetical protein